MRNKVAKHLKKEVALKMYVGDDVTAEDVMKGRKDVYASRDFKAVYRARKKKHNNPHHSTNSVQYPTKPGIKFIGREVLRRKQSKKTT